MNKQHLLKADSESRPEKPLSRRKEREKLTIYTAVSAMISQLGSSGDKCKSYRTTRSDRRRGKLRRVCSAVQFPVVNSLCCSWSPMMIDWMFIEIDEQRCNASRLLIAFRWRSDGNFRSMSLSQQDRCNSSMFSGHIIGDRMRIGDISLQIESIRTI